jgi:Uma2 family endonuclease
MHANAILLDVTQSKGSRRRATYDDVLKAPEHMIAELIDGELFTSPQPANRHVFAATRLGGALTPLQQGQGSLGGWWIMFEPELHLGDDVLVPDLAGWRYQHMPEVPDAPFFTLRPDWICEVLSPSTERLDRTRKLRVYARERVSHAWLVDPIDKTVEVLCLDSSRHWVPHATYSSDDRIRAVPFDAIEIKLVHLWRPVPSAEAPPAAERRAKAPRRVTPRAAVHKRS